jgi:ABC-type polysaccharide/polyol phosphate transport system ATPase subunit
MSEVVITVENLSKRYVVGHQSAQRTRQTTLRDIIAREAKNFTRKAIDLVRGQQIIQGDEMEEFWALRNVNFEVQRGEVVGVIGRNGAGKSTLLKILSRVTEPSEGRVTLRGRVASLLEVGTGFHQELTGRENIFLNGAILGMTQREIRRKFDEIVSFAEVERFLDTPVKRYSSGMYVRLAFAVAAHLEPEILIVDEVLAVGDAEFQKKCLGKIDEVARREGRTVLFVSHNLAAISELCNRAIVLRTGAIVANGVVSESIAAYLSHGASGESYAAPNQFDTPHVSRLEVVTSDPNRVQRFGAPLEVKICIRHLRPMVQGCFSFCIVNQFNQPVIYAYAHYPEYVVGRIPGETFLVCRFPTIRLNVGRYHLSTSLGETPGGRHYESLDGLCPFDVIRTDKNILWGWHPSLCCYHEEYAWSSFDQPRQFEHRSSPSNQTVEIVER